MSVSPVLLARDAQAKLALILALCLSIHLSICPSVCPSVCLSATAWVTRMYAALRVASHIDYRLLVGNSPSIGCKNWGTGKYTRSDCIGHQILEKNVWKSNWKVNLNHYNKIPAWTWTWHCGYTDWSQKHRLLSTVCLRLLKYNDASASVFLPTSYFLFENCVFDVLIIVLGKVNLLQT